MRMEPRPGSEFRGFRKAAWACTAADTPVGWQTKLKEGVLETAEAAVRTSTLLATAVQGVGTEVASTVVLDGARNLEGALLLRAASSAPGGAGVCGFAAAARTQLPGGAAMNGSLCCDRVGSAMGGLGSGGSRLDNQSKVSAPRA